MTNIRVASWNVREGVSVDPRVSRMATVAEIAAVITSLNIDVIALQEVDFPKNDASFILTAVAEKTALKHVAVNVLSESSFTEKTCAGVAIASRHPITSTKQALLTNPNLETRIDGEVIRMHDKGFVAATVKSPFGYFYLASLHLFPMHLFGRRADEGQFRLIWSELSEKLSKLNGLPIIICGDFNTEMRELIADVDSSRLTRAIVDVPTYRNSSFDDILYSESFISNTTEVVSTFSDHRLCLAELAWNKGSRVLE